MSISVPGVSCVTWQPSQMMAVGRNVKVNCGVWFISPEIGRRETKLDEDIHY